MTQRNDIQILHNNNFKDNIKHYGQVLFVCNKKDFFSEICDFLEKNNYELIYDERKSFKCRIGIDIKNKKYELKKPGDIDYPYISFSFSDIQPVNIEELKYVLRIKDDKPPVNNPELREEIQNIIDYFQIEDTIDTFKERPHIDIGILENFEVSETFIDFFKKEINWEVLYKTVNLSEEFIEKWTKHKNPELWELVFEHQTNNISENFIKKHIDKAQNIKENISYLSDEFIKNNPDKINWVYLIINKKLSQEYVNEKFKIIFDTLSLSSFLNVIGNYQIDEENILNNIDNTNDELVYHYIKNNPVSLEFVEKTLPEDTDYWWRTLSENPNINRDIISTYKDYLYWESISNFYPLDKEMILEFENYIFWDILFLNENIDNKIFKDLKDKFDVVLQRIRGKEKTEMQHYEIILYHEFFNDKNYPPSMMFFSVFPHSSTIINSTRKIPFLDEEKKEEIKYMLN